MPYDVEPAVLAWARQKAGLTLEDAAKELRVSVSTLSAWESGDEKPGLTALRKMASNISSVSLRVNVFCWLG